MCGINGIVNYSNQLDRSIVQKMNNILSHRGPDGKGIQSFKSCCIGHVRLSIIDVEGSSQPLCNEDGTIWITFNGEIYNYKDLRNDLKEKGHRFRTNGDTETLVHLYEEYKEEMLSYINGMFAFAIWDNINERLFIARDRLGIKPVYYYFENGLFVFSSEQKGILEHPKIERELSEEGLWNYLTFRSVPAPLTLYQGIFKLLPGHYIKLSNNDISIKKYWEIPINRELYNDNLFLLAQKTESLLIKSVKRRMMSDVPIGAFLSGGIDSSLIVAIMSKLSKSPVKTYSVGFKNFKSNEAPFAKKVSEYYQSDHHELILEEDEYISYIDKLTWLRDAPLSEPADIPLYLLSKSASEKVKVLLSGEGSDELFGGYPKYRFDNFSKILHWMPNKIKRRMITILPGKFRKFEVALKSLTEKKIENRWPQWFSPFNFAEKSYLLNIVKRYSNPVEKLIVENFLKNSIEHMLFCDCKIWLPDNLLDRGDKMTMGASVEGRVPFLDHELVEFSFGLPLNVKINNFVGKRIIKEIAKKYLPSLIVNRKKSGFVVPLNLWFKDKLKDYCYSTICGTNSLCSSIFNKKFCEDLLYSHFTSKKDYSLQIWTLLGISIWYKVNIERD